MRSALCKGRQKVVGRQAWWRTKVGRHLHVQFIRRSPAAVGARPLQAWQVFRPRLRPTRCTCCGAPGPGAPRNGKIVGGPQGYDEISRLEFDWCTSCFGAFSGSVHFNALRLPHRAYETCQRRFFAEGVPRSCGNGLGGWNYQGWHPVNFRLSLEYRGHDAT